MQNENLDYLEDLYLKYQNNPESISQDWKYFFEGVQFGHSKSASKIGELSSQEIDVYHLINAYRNRGHFEADTNPLKKTKSTGQLEPSLFNLTKEDLNKKFQIGRLVGKENSTLAEIIEHLKSSYCGTLTVQCAEASPEIRGWFFKQLETPYPRLDIKTEEKKELLESLTRAESLEKFIHTRYVGTKRFSIEGGDALLPMLETLIQKCTALKAKEIMIGMAHRGRVNLLSNLMGKSLEYIFADFNGPTELTEPLDDFDGDVKYHLGYTNTKNTPHGPCHVSHAYNPWHLEAVNPVLLGMVRAAQRRRKDTSERKSVIPVLIHGDAAFASQGVILETFQMSQVKGYTVGGTIHIIVDNQIGFTTNPENSRSSHYSSDVSKVLAIPVLHVNGDDPEACLQAMNMALQYRQEFGKDIVINLVCYRRFGHNEGDEPAYTQPLMYEFIRKHPTVRSLYAQKLLNEKVIVSDEADQLVEAQMAKIQIIYEKTKANPPKIKPFKFEGNWSGLRKATPEDIFKPCNTKIDKRILTEIGVKLSEFPKDFTPHPKLLKLLESRKNMALEKEPIDWGMGELLAYGSLLHEGTSVRLSGQDCVRGTFTHRHAGIYDVKTNQVYKALDDINADTVEFCVYDSILSEYAVLGFEYGNATCDPTFLTLWEAQFGDFANGAQIIIDQFLTSGENKWMQMTGLVLLLPHGYEGQGPEHSSARIERFLNLAAQNNIQVCNLTSPAQIYHALRRQMKRDFRKPLIIMSPKKLLRYPRAISTLEELANGEFHEVIDDCILTDKKSVQQIAFCSGKIYYELLEEREKLKDHKTALVRLEQIYPFASAQVTQIIKSYPKVQKISWVQEEPRNMGAYQHVYFKFQELFKQTSLAFDLEYVGRPERSSPATGSIYRHNQEQTQVLNDCFTL